VSSGITTRNLCQNYEKQLAAVKLMSAHAHDYSRTLTWSLKGLFSQSMVALTGWSLTKGKKHCSMLPFSSLEVL